MASSTAASPVKASSAWGAAQMLQMNHYGLELSLKIHQLLKITYWSFDVHQHAPQARGATGGAARRTRRWKMQGSSPHWGSRETPLVA